MQWFKKTKAPRDLYLTTPLVLYSVNYAAVSLASTLSGCGVNLRYGFIVLKPAGNFTLASSSEIEGTMMQSSPLFQFTGVATLYFDVSCSESITRKISSKLRPVLAGYVIISLTFLSG